MATRADRFRELFERANGGEYPAGALDPEEVIRKEDERLWALYRELDVSQREAVDLVEPVVDTSQATASRRIREMGEEILTSPARTAAVDAEEPIVEHWPEPLAEAYRDVLARAIADLTALRELSNTTHQAPDWAAERFPELVGVGGQVGRSLGLDEGDIAAVEAPDATNR